MIRINIKKDNYVKVKFFKTKKELFSFCALELCLFKGDDDQEHINQTFLLTEKIWNTDVGQIIKTDLDHNICIAGKVIPVNHLNV